MGTALIYSIPEKLDIVILIYSWSLGGEHIRISI